MQRFLYFVLQLYAAVIATLLLSDYLITNHRIAQFRKMEDCCSTATEQYRSFLGVTQVTSRLAALPTGRALTRAEKYSALASWQTALESSIRDRPSIDWDQPGQYAANRLNRFLAGRHLGPADVSNLVEKFRDAGPDVDPTLDDDEDKTVSYLMKNLPYLNAVSDIAGGQLHQMLVKQAGNSKELEIYVVAQEAVKSESEATPGCGSQGGVDSASSLGRTAVVGAASRGFLECLRGAVHQKLAEIAS